MSKSLPFNNHCLLIKFFCIKTVINRYDESEHGANADHAPEEQDYVDLKDLLKELDDVVVDTSVTCSEIQYVLSSALCASASS